MKTKKIGLSPWQRPRSQRRLFLFTDHVFQSGVDKGKSIKRCLVHGFDEILVSVGESRLLAQELSVEVAAVTWGFLWARISVSLMQ